MAKAKGIFPVEITNIAGFGYPDDSLVTVFQNDTVQIHYIEYSAAPGVLFANAPNGSKLWDNTNGNLYHKRGAMGAIDGTWYHQAVNSQ